MFDIEGSSADPAGAANAPSPRQGTTPAVRRRALLLALPLALPLALAACGKKGAPSPPGPPEKVIYPRVYPAR